VDVALSGRGHIAACGFHQPDERRHSADFAAGRRPKVVALALEPAEMHTGASPPTLDIDGLNIVYDTEEGSIPAARNVTLEIRPRESFGLVGESGSGKTTLALGAIRYLAENGRIESGTVRLKGESITDIPMRDMFTIWGKRIGMVYQHPGTALNPSLSIGRQIAESAVIHQSLSKAEASGKAIRMLAKVAMPHPERIMRLYPHQLSGGMLQRCVIAMGLINGPELLIMDEPTTALDVTTQAVVLDLTADLMREFHSAVLYITHDLAVVAKICDRIGVMYAGQLVEVGPTREIFHNARHPYTMNLLGCIPHFEPESRKHSLVSIPGRIPRVTELPEGCIFSPRCVFAQDKCRRSPPPWFERSRQHRTACFFHDDLPKKIEDVAGRKHYPAPKDTAPLLETKALKKQFEVTESRSFFRRKQHKQVTAVNEVSLTIPQGLTLGIVGESGCGKTTLLRVIIGLSAPTAGEALLNGAALKPTTAKRPRSRLKEIQMVFQNPDASLNPKQSIAQAIGRPMVLFEPGIDKAALTEQTHSLLAAVNLPAHYAERYPGELSGGEKQRVAIARAFAADPRLVLLDEPLSALDVSVQASLVNLLFDLQAEKGATYLFISHDLAAVHHLSDHIAVMYLGSIVEAGDADLVFAPPHHPYTEALLSAIPIADPDTIQENIRLSGTVPGAVNIPAGCPFHTRCPRKIGEICETTPPPWQNHKHRNRIRCHISLESLREMQSGVFISGGKS
jgi:peptide/nickel transport system ATP-binding protein